MFKYNQLYSAMNNTTISIYRQKHFLWTIPGPLSSYSPFVIHIFWNVLNDDNIEPPIHTLYFLSGGAITLIFILWGANFLSSSVNLSPIPSYIVLPPDKTILFYKSLLISISLFIIESYTCL